MAPARVAALGSGWDREQHNPPSMWPHPGSSSPCSSPCSCSRCSSAPQLPSSNSRSSSNNNGWVGGGSRSRGFLLPPLPGSNPTQDMRGLLARFRAAGSGPSCGSLPGSRGCCDGQGAGRQGQHFMAHTWWRQCSRSSTVLGALEVSEEVITGRGCWGSWLFVYV